MCVLGFRSGLISLNMRSISGVLRIISGISAFVISRSIAARMFWSRGLPCSRWFSSLNIGTACASSFINRILSSGSDVELICCPCCVSLMMLLPVASFHMRSAAIRAANAPPEGDMPVRCAKASLRTSPCNSS